eukprot:2383181-Rhodomonas_salina.1
MSVCVSVQLCGMRCVLRGDMESWTSGERKGVRVLPAADDSRSLPRCACALIPETFEGQAR